MCVSIMSFISFSSFMCYFYFIETSKILLTCFLCTDCIGSNCMQIEPGEWQYATNNPNPDSSDDDSIAEEDEENYIGLIHDLLIFCFE